MDSRQNKTSAHLDDVDRSLDFALTQTPQEAIEVILAGTQNAQKSGKPLPVSLLRGYKQALRDFSRGASSSQDFWTAAAAVINYQSFLDQRDGSAPDPLKVSHSCLATRNELSGGNVFGGMTFSDCVVDLDTQVFDRVLFRNSVIRYKGGIAHLSNVQFINCRFLLELPRSTLPQQPSLLLAILNSPNETSVSVSGE
jgi:hypothetical protein